MKKLSFLSLVLGATLGATQTQAYQYQIDAAYDHHEIDDITGLTTDAGDFNLQATAYFENIKTKNVPLQEAAFLSQTSNIYGTYTYNFRDVEFTDFNGEINADTHDFTGGFEYFNRQNGLYLNAELGRSSTDSEVTLSSETVNLPEYDVTHYRALFGFMPQNNLLIAAGVQGYNATGEQKEAGLAARAKYVTALGQKGQYLNLEANVNLNGIDGYFNETDTYQVAADFYINPTWSIGSNYTFVDYGSEDTDSISIRTKKYFNQDVGIGAEVNFAEDDTVYGVRGTYRF